MLGSTAGQASTLGLGANKRAMILSGRSRGAPRLPSEFTYAMVRQKKAPHEGTRTEQERAWAGGKN